MQCIPLVFSRNQVVRLSFTLSLESMNDGVGMRHAVFKPAVLSHSYKQDCYRDNLNISSTTLLNESIPPTTISGPANVAELPYMEGYTCKLDVRTLGANKGHAKIKICCQLQLAISWEPKYQLIM